MGTQTAQTGVYMSEKKVNGKIKSTFPQRGYAWIEGVDGVDYFAHQSHFRGIFIEDMWVGQSVVFEPNDGPKGPFATGITSVDGLSE